jgi:hypothetical protein
MPVDKVVKNTDPLPIYPVLILKNGNRIELKAAEIDFLLNE